MSVFVVRVRLRDHETGTEPFYRLAGAYRTREAAETTARIVRTRTERNLAPRLERRTLGGITAEVDVIETDARAARYHYLDLADEADRVIRTHYRGGPQ